MTTRVDFRTADIALAAYLMLSKCQLGSVDTSDQRRVSFVFIHKPEIQAASLQFYNRKTQVEPIAFMEQIRTLKGLTRNGFGG